MKGVTRYILRQLVGATLFVTLALAGVVWLSQSLRFVDLIINRGLSFFTFVKLTLLLLPSFLGMLLPIALFCAVMYTYHRLTIDSELVVLRAAGLSQWALAKPALVLAAAVTVIGYGITLYWMPWGFRDFKDRQFVIRSDYSNVLLQEGAFNTIGDGLTVYIRARRPNGTVLGIMVHDNRDPAAPVTMMAERGKLTRTPEGPRLVLISGNRQEYDPEGRKLGLLYFDRYSFDLSSLFAMNRPRWREPRERYLHELFREPTDAGERAYADKLRAEGHQRLVAPLFAVVFALIGLAAHLGGEYDRRGRLARMLVAAGAGVLFQGSGLAVAHLAATTPVVTPVMYANPAAWAGAAVFFMVRHRRARRRPAMAGAEAGAA